MSREITYKTTQVKYERLKSILQKMGKVVVAFSGGVDSTFLLKVSHDILGNGVLAVIASSKIFPEIEMKNAIEFAKKMNIQYRIVKTNEKKEESREEGRNCNYNAECPR